MNENMKKLIFIVNPISGTQSKELILNLLDEKIDKEKYTWDVVYTKRAGHAIEIAAQAAEMKTDVVVAIGGDGTINEIGRSLVHTETALGIIPCGSGNGLARHLHIPMEPKKALEIINDGICDIIDYGKINGTDFFLYLRSRIRRFRQSEICQCRKTRIIDLSGKNIAGESDLSTRNLRTGNRRRYL